MEEDEPRGINLGIKHKKNEKDRDSGKVKGEDFIVEVSSWSDQAKESREVHDVWWRRSNGSQPYMDIDSVMGRMEECSDVKN